MSVTISARHDCPEVNKFTLEFLHSSFLITVTRAAERKNTKAKHHTQGFYEDPACMYLCVHTQMLMPDTCLHMQSPTHIEYLFVMTSF